MMSTKITAEHLNRRAVVYVRQSTPNQVHDNLESKRRQYALADLARDLGFATVDVIDDDLGRSGSGQIRRPGFEKLVTELATRDVGAVFCLEASRLARNGRDWHTLLDLCGLVEAVIVDPEGVYDPRHSNDRLLLGLKGTLSEYELTLLRQRALSAIEDKAARGELQFSLPVGLCWTHAGEIELHPDARIQEALRLVFRKYTEMGSMRQVLRWFHEEKLSLPKRRHGADGEEVEWVLPVYSTIHRLLTTPLYAGAYAWGRTTHTQSGSKHAKPRDEWKVLLIDHHRGYITWQEYLLIQKTMAENAHGNPWSRRKAGRGGQALLTGFLRCRRCGRRLYVSYTGGGNTYYYCRGSKLQDGGKCIAFSGVPVDAVISSEVLNAVERPALEAALLAADTEERRCREESHAFELELEQARYRARLAERRYERVDPDNRLVAPELERRWNDALSDVVAIEQKLEARAIATTPTLDRERLLQLAETLPKVWNDERTDTRAKQRIVRVVIDEIIADVDEVKGQVILVVRWAGGRHSEVRAKRRRQGEHRLTTSLEAIEVIRRMGPYCNDGQVASTLNRLGLKTARGHSWTSARVRAVRYRHGLTDAVLSAAASEAPAVTLKEAAERLGTNTIRVRKLIADGILKAEQVVPYAPWRIPEAALSAPEVSCAMAAPTGRRPRKRTTEDRNLVIPGL